MNFAELDEVLGVWKARLASIAENLLDLQSETSYRSLTGTGGLEKVTVTGLTAARLKPALGAMHTMFEQFGLLQSTIDRAEALRKQLPAFFGGDAKAREVQQLLFGRSIQLPAVEIPLEQRTLVSGIRSAQQVTPEELLAPMERSFTAARDAVMAVDRAWMDFTDESSRLRGEIERLRRQKALPSAQLAPSLDAAGARLEAVGARMKTDPLGAESGLRLEVQPLLDEVNRRVEAALQLGALLRSARHTAQHLAETHCSAVALAAEAQEKTASRTGSALPVAEDRTQGVVDWLCRLEQKFADGSVEAVTVGLRHWNIAADTCVQQDRKVCEAARARMEQRSELRGRFDALKAKARRFGIAENNDVTSLGRQVEGLLYGDPMDLAGAASAVAQYEKCLRQDRREAQLR